MARRHPRNKEEKGKKTPDTAFSFGCPLPRGPRYRRETGSCCSRRAHAVGQVSVWYLGPNLSWAWEAKQPWGQETSLRRGEGSGPCKVGGVRVCAPPLLAPKFSPDGPSATVPVLGCSFPEESYPSLANQPSSGAKQGDVRCASEGGQRPLRGSVLCLLGSLCPHGLHAQRLPWASLACWRGPGSGHMAWGTQVSSPGRARLTALGKRDRVHGTSSEEASTSARGGKPKQPPWARGP